MQCTLTFPVTGACPAADVHGGASARVRVDRGVRWHGLHGSPSTLESLRPHPRASR
jgi:hypothetical protein